MDIAIIGGGAAGVLAGIACGKEHRIMIFERNEKLMKKVYITGKGRCNLTNARDISEFIDEIVNNPYFMYSSLYRFTNHDIISIVEEYVPTKTERGGRVFPATDKASDVMKALEEKLSENRPEIYYRCEVKGIEKKDRFVVDTSKGRYEADRVIVTTGGFTYGFTYPASGSRGDGYDFAKAFGHTVVPPKGSLLGLVTEEDVSDLEGLSLKNIGVSFPKASFDAVGEMVFTKNGVSGPLILTLSAYINRDPEGLLTIDLKPGLTPAELDRRILRDFEAYKNKDLRNALKDLTVNAMIEPVLNIAGVDPFKKVHQVTREERERIIAAMKAFPLHIADTENDRRGIVTSGGVDTDEIDPTTMESKRVEGLYFAGEVLDVDALTGGYNLQIAWSTGYAAGSAAGGSDGE